MSIKDDWIKSIRERIAQEAEAKKQQASERQNTLAEAEAHLQDEQAKNYYAAEKELERLREPILELVEYLRNAGYEVEFSLAEERFRISADFLSFSEDTLYSEVELEQIRDSLGSEVSRSEFRYRDNDSGWWKLKRRRHFTYLSQLDKVKNVDGSWSTGQDREYYERIDYSITAPVLSLTIKHPQLLRAHSVVIFLEPHRYHDQINEITKLEKSVYKSETHRGSYKKTLVTPTVSEHTTDAELCLLASYKHVGVRLSGKALVAGDGDSYVTRSMVYSPEECMEFIEKELRRSIEFMETRHSEEEDWHREKNDREVVADSLAAQFLRRFLGIK